MKSGCKESFCMHVSISSNNFFKTISESKACKGRMCRSEICNQITLFIPYIYAAKLFQQISIKIMLSLEIHMCGVLPGHLCPIGFQPAIRAANPYPCCPPSPPSHIPAAPLTSGHAGMRAGPQAIPARPECRRRAGLRPSWRAALIRPANPNPYRRHHRQSTSLPPPHERARGHANEATGDPARPERRRPAPPALWQASPHPRCQAESLPPPSPPSRIPAAPSRAG